MEKNTNGEWRPTRKRKKRRIARRIAAIVIAIALIVMAGVAIYFALGSLSLGAIKYQEYYREIDISDRVVTDMAVWLSELDGQEISGSWLKERCGKITIQSKLILEKGDEEGDHFREYIEEEAYELAGKKIDEAFSGIMSEIIADRLVASGYADSVSSQEAMNIADEVLEMNLAEYARDNGVTFLAGIDELTDELTIGSGTFSVAKGSISMKPQGGEERTVGYICKDNCLVLVDDGLVYYGEESDNE